MVFPLQSENSLLEDFCPLGQRQVRTQPPMGTLPGLLKPLATRCCCVTWESKGTQHPDAGSCAGTQGMPPASWKDRINKAHPETHATLYKGHPAQWKKNLLFLVKLLDHTVPSANYISALPFPRVVCQLNRNHFDRAVSTERCGGWASTGSRGSCAGQPWVSRELSTQTE